MRTTLTIDPDVEELLKQEAHRLRCPMKKVVNDALRRGLTGTRGHKPLSPYKVVPFRTRLRPGIDRRAMNRLADEMEDDATIEGKSR